MSTSLTPLRYDPALGCDEALDAWCNAHCGSATFPWASSARPSRLVARQPSTGQGGLVFACYDANVLADLDGVTSNLTLRAPDLCGSRLSAYVHSLKQTRESAALVGVMLECHAAQRAAREKSAVSSQDELARRKRNIVALHQPLLRSRLSSSSGSGPPSSAVAAWLENRNGDDGGGARSRATDAAECIAHGSGEWQRLAPESSSEPYLLAPDVLPRANLSKWWWGVCDDDLRHGALRPPRAAVLQAWHPHGRGCEALRKGRPYLPSLRTLGAAFCRRHAGRTVLFVGDSVQGQLFVSFAMALGVYRTERQMAGVLRDKLRCAKDKHYLMSLENVHEFFLNMQLCAANPDEGVRAIFVRNELLWLDEMPAERVPRNFLMCGWAKREWLHADMLVLNRGMHYTEDSVLARELAATFEGLNAARRRRGGASSSTKPITPPIANSVVYRGTHAPIPSCHILDDPLPKPFAYTAARDDPMVRGYHWAEFGRQNGIARDLAALNNLTYLDVHTATSSRPGGHMPLRKGTSGDCAHYCLPGPIDEWVRLLLALWT